MVCGSLLLFWGILAIDRESLPIDRGALSIDLESLPIDREPLPIDLESLSIDLEPLPVDRESLPIDRECLPMSLRVCSINCGKCTSLLPEGGCGLIVLRIEKGQGEMVESIPEYVHGILAHDLNRGLSLTTSGH